MLVTDYMKLSPLDRLFALSSLINEHKKIYLKEERDLLCRDIALEVANLVYGEDSKYFKEIADMLRKIERRNFTNEQKELEYDKILEVVRKRLKYIRGD